MSIKYSMSEMKNPQNPTAPTRFYAKCQVREHVDLNRIASEVAHDSSLTEGDVQHVMRCVIHKLKAHLNDGDSVGLGDLGSFQYQLSSRGVESKNDFTPEHITKARIQFRPGSLLHTPLTALRFEQVMPIKTRREAKKNG